MSELNLASPFLSLFLLFVFVAFHRVCFARAGLAIRKHCGVVTLDHFGDQATDLEQLEDLLLAARGLNDLVKFEIFRACA